MSSARWHLTDGYCNAHRFPHKKLQCTTLVKYNKTKSVQMHLQHNQQMELHQTWMCLFQFLNKNHSEYQHNPHLIHKKPHFDADQVRTDICNGMISVHNPQIGFNTRQEIMCANSWTCETGCYNWVLLLWNLAGRLAAVLLRHQLKVRMIGNL